MIVDYLIVGQGIAGSVLAFTLLQKGKKVLVLDNEAENTSSKVAAGICNPITGRFLQKTWQADLIFPFLRKFYQKMEAELGAKFLLEMSVYRTFKSVEEQNEWQGRSSDSIWQDFLNTEVKDADYQDFIHNPMGGWETKQSYHIKVDILLAACKKYLLSKQASRTTNFNYDDLQIIDNQVVWKDVQAQKIIFCEGVKALQNPYFAWLPFRPVKGEWIKIKIENVNLNSIINQGIFILPLQNNEFKVGSTYRWDDLNEEITLEGRQELLTKLEAILTLPFSIIEQKAGIRPASQERRPFMGLHPQFKNVGIFNGLGTKGISLAPYFAEELANYLENPNEFSLNKEVNISRYYDLAKTSDFIDVN